MADIQQYLDDILKARYGKDVRQSIHDAINMINEAVIDSGLDAGNLPVNKGIFMGTDLNDIDEDSVYFISGSSSEGSGVAHTPTDTTGKEEFSGWVFTRKIGNSSSKLKLQIYVSWVTAIIYNRRTDPKEGLYNGWRTQGIPKPLTHYTIEKFNVEKNAIEQSDGYYDKGVWEDHTGWSSAMIKLKEHHKYYFYNINVFMSFWKDGVYTGTQINPEKVSYSPIEDTTLKIYRFTVPDNLDYDSIYIPSRNIADYQLIGSPFPLPTYVFEAEKKEDIIEVESGRIVNKEEVDQLEIGMMHDGVMTFLGYYSPTDVSISTDILFFKKGTVVDTKNTGITCSLRGMTADSFFYKTGITRYEFEQDTYCSVNAAVESPNWTSDIPNLTKMEKFYFIRIIREEDRRKNPWKGKVWWAYGTSITDIGPNDTTGNNGHSGKYPLSLEAFSELQRNNGAIGSGGILDDKPDNLNYRKKILQTPYDTDLVTIETLPNDDYTNHLGEIGDTDGSTIVGALTQCFEYLTTETRARIVLLIVTGSIHTISSETPEENYKPYEATRTNWRKAVEKITELANLYGVTVIDADANALDWGRRKTGLTYRDHIHLNYLGGEIFGRYIWEQLKNIQPYTQGF